MPTVQSKLRTSYNLATPIQHLLLDALDQAKDQAYDQHWIDAILKAATDHHDACTRIHNIAICLDRRPVPARSHPPPSSFPPPTQPSQRSTLP
ncbi:hypothetical protein ES708_32290 [subsurface metagenome]